MPPVHLFAPAQIDALTTALLALRDRPHDLPLALTVPAQPPSNYQSAGKAGQLMEDLAFFSCHAINDRGVRSRGRFCFSTLGSLVIVFR
jgi:hypothetical protein